MLICLRYLNKDGSNPDNNKQIEILLRLLDLKDTKLVEWNFRNLQITINKSHDLEDGDKKFLKDLLSIPGNKSAYESKLLKKKIQNFLIKNNSSRSVSNVDDSEKIKVDVDIIDRRGKSEWDEIEWVVWKISLNPLSELFKDGQVKSVVYQFDSTFRDKRIEIFSSDHNENYSVNVMGWQERKFDIELHQNDNTILKMVGDLKETVDVKPTKESA
jgi:hypothetical protein